MFYDIIWKRESGVKIMFDIKFINFLEKGANDGVGREEEWEKKGWWRNGDLERMKGKIDIER